MVQQILLAENREPNSDSSKEVPTSYKPDEDGQPDLCAFCLDHIQEPEKLHCNHSFCKSCLELYREARSWVANRCPICRRSLDGNASKQLNSCDLFQDWRLFSFMMVLLTLLSVGPFYLLLLYW
ncbi:E3 ubiquitin-protein ligase RNF125 [Drosophila eugracilis]|uniref:E3 ubiquitin-protein ligase RNF125 n=1 Tax=Drosophila eugracilis TaxID=29029 RepID=UPI001BD97F33|nr:E3 ubiquitin-protein ligase RNF125 [Drosophila eugracilis]